MSQDNEVLVKVEGVSKIFCRDLKKSLLYGLQDSARDLFSWGKQGTGDSRQGTGDRRQVTGNREQGSEPAGTSTSFLSPDSRPLSPSSSSSSNSKSKIHNSKFSRSLRPGEFLAVDNVSFELRRGDCLGLIGRNGAGKTTLLKMLNGLIKPDAGRIEMRGRVGALIALGAGFNPILSGRENIYVNAAILGLSKAEIDAKIDDIIDFAEIRDFIDAPVQSYSSGMQVRLGFAVATAMEPNILIVDEVLAVGDFRFRWKCLERIKKLREQGVSIILVSHQAADLMRTCEKGVMLERGKMVCFSQIQEALHHYESEKQEEDVEPNEEGNLQGAKIESITLRTEDLHDSSIFIVDIEVFAARAMTNMRMVIGFFHSNSGPLFHVSSYLDREWISLERGSNRFSVELSGFTLQSGSCTAEVSLRGESLGDVFDQKQSNNQLQILEPQPNYEGFGVNGAILPRARWIL